MTSAAARFDALPPFPFRQLAALLEDVPPASGMTVLDLSIGEPQHQPPPSLTEALAANAGRWNKYPPPAGTPSFRQTVANWLEQRFGLTPRSVDPSINVLPLAGTKEGLFLLPMAVPTNSVSGSSKVLMPNPLYSVYLGGACGADFEPVVLAAHAENGFLPNLDAVTAETWQQTAIFYLCNPSNPQGAIAGRDYLARAVSLAREHGFLLCVDECYSELYDDQAPIGALAVAQDLNGNFDNVVVMHSLSKRSNAAGLRSGFVAGDPAVLRRFLRLRAYGAAVQPLPVMAAAEALWSDEAHVVSNRNAYREKIDLAQRRLGNRYGFFRPPGGFFLWLDVGNGIDATRCLWLQAAVKVLPGHSLTAKMPDDRSDPGSRYIRVALVHELDVIDEALGRMIEVLG